MLKFNARKPAILVTGGMGYIGSHTTIELIKAGYQVVIADNLVNSSVKVLPRIEKICGSTIPFVQIDIRDRVKVGDIFREFSINCVIHFAGLKAVGESVEKPLDYFDNNVYGTLSLLQAMRVANVKRFVFSSSATVYGNPHSVPIKEDFPLQVTNPYGRSKLMCEDILRDLLLAEPDWHVAMLRYFNPVGAHPSGLIGEAPLGTPNNLMPFITQVAAGKREKLSIFGNDYPTPDGTGVRDYIHVVDLAKGHVAAVRFLENKNESITANLGTGVGISVLQLLQTFQNVTGLKIAHEYVARRPGDVVSCFSDPSLAEKLLEWKAVESVSKMCSDSWRWQSLNPNGF